MQKCGVSRAGRWQCALPVLRPSLFPGMQGDSSQLPGRRHVATPRKCTGGEGPWGQDLRTQRLLEGVSSRSAAPGGKAGTAPGFSCSACGGLGCGVARTGACVGQLCQPRFAACCWRPHGVHWRVQTPGSCPLLELHVLRAGLLATGPPMKLHAGTQRSPPHKGALVYHPLARFSRKCILSLILSGHFRIIATHVITAGGRALGPGDAGAPGTEKGAAPANASPLLGGLGLLRSRAVAGGGVMWADCQQHSHPSH